MDFYIIIALAAYVTGAFGYIGFLVKNDAFFRRMGSTFFTAGLIIQTLVVLSVLAGSGALPVANLRQSLGFSAWALALVFVFFEWRYKLAVLGAAAAPITALTLLVSLFLPDTAAASPRLLKSAWTMLHVFPVFLGNASFVLAALVGGAYILTERAIKNKKRGFFFRRMPPLDTLDRMGYACVAVGFILLTTGLAAGFVYAKSVWGRWWSADPKEVWSLVTWFLYAALIHERLAVGWRGRRAAWMAIFGVAVMLFTFFGVNLLLSGHHRQFFG
ncbi:MAG: c-type cytochrome biogenesis protein CcsB [Deltaproteobacteria bacterium]|nr:c-type cytochrome biogenesis protein CcsB [Deltaproteobacteria bacterium]